MEANKKREDYEKPRTLPWLMDEYLVIDHRRLIYTVNNRGHITVHFPGGKNVMLEILRLKNRKIVMPDRLRVDRF